MHGFVACIADAISALVELLKSIFDGSIVEQLKSLWSALTKLSLADIETALGSWWQSWKPRLLSENPGIRGHAWGYLAGDLIGEIALFYVGGAALKALKEAKLATRFDRLMLRAVPKLEKGIEGLRNMGGKTLKTLTEASEVVKKKFARGVAPVTQAVEKTTKKLLRVSRAMREKILWGTLKEPGSSRIIGGRPIGKRPRSWCRRGRRRTPLEAPLRPWEETSRPLTVARLSTGPGFSRRYRRSRW